MLCFASNLQRDYFKRRCPENKESSFGSPCYLFSPEHGGRGVAGGGALKVRLLAPLQDEHAGGGPRRHHRTVCNTARQNRQLKTARQNRHTPPKLPQWATELAIKVLK